MENSFLEPNGLMIEKQACKKNGRILLSRYGHFQYYYYYL